MTRKQQRGVLIGGGVGLLCVAVILVLFAMKDAVTYFHTPGDVVDAIAEETGASVVELGTHNLPDDGTYRTFMLDLANAVAAALAA